MTADPRLYQIATLASLLIYGIGWLDFDITVPRVMLLLATVLVTQAVGDRWTARRLGRAIPVNVRSALISGLSLCLLLRTNDVALAVLAAVVTIAAKFVIRFRGKHVCNPSDVTFSFLAFYCALLFGRSLYLGEPMTIPLHRLESGGLLLFAFFMISDPKTTPCTRLGRIVFSALVAYGAWYVQFRLFRTNGLLWSLAACSMTVPLIDWLLPGSLYQWTTAGSTRPRPTIDVANFALQRSTV